MNVGRWVVRRKVTVFVGSWSRHDLNKPWKSRHQEEAVTESGCHTSIMRRTSSSTRLRSPSPPTSVTVTSRSSHAQFAGTCRKGPAVLGTKKPRSEEHTSELQSRGHLVCRL